MKTNKIFDVAVIGGGPGGYPAAIKAAQLGKSVALIEANELGGTCLNRGCIPSKALIACAEMLHNIKRASDFGIHIEKFSFDFPSMVKRKSQVVGKVRKGLETVIASNGITWIKGFGVLKSPNKILVKGESSLEIEAKKIILATGSSPREMTSFPFDGKRILDSNSMLEIQKIPKRLLIVGGGIIGSEFASLYREFDVEVVILEALDRLIPMESLSVSRALEKAFKQKGIVIETNAFVKSIKNRGEDVLLTLADGKTYEGDLVLVATGRSLNLSGIGLETVGVNLLENGLIEVNEQMETNVAGIYAVGDIASKWWLAHVASHQGIIAASNASGFPKKMRYNAVPSVIFTNPEIATVGYSLEQAIQEGFSATVGAFPFLALGKSQATGQTEGFAQIVSDKKTGQLLGAQVVGHGASALIAEMAIAIANELTLECIAETIHAHPTIAESWLEAALVALKEPLHLPKGRDKKETD